MKKNLNKPFLYFEVLLIAFFLLSTIGFILNSNNIFVKATDPALAAVLTPFLLSALMSVMGKAKELIVLTLYYCGLFAIPAIGIVLYKKKYLIVHIILILAIISNLLSLLYLYHQMKYL